MAGKTNPTYLSLFSGCGGLDLGFHQAGFLGALSVDIDPAALRVHERNIRTPVEQLDLSEGIPTLNLRGTLDVLLAGSPCQGFSTVGLRRVDDPRNSLLLVAVGVAAHYRPKVVIAENVLGAISGQHRSFWSQLHARLRAIGYNTHEIQVDSHSFGVAQKRRRVFLFAWRTGALPSFSLEERKRKVLGDVLSGLEGAPNHLPVHLQRSTDAYKIASRIGQGQKLTNSRGGETAIHTWNIPEVFGSTTAGEKSVLEQILKLRRQDRQRTFGDADPVRTDVLTKQFGELTISSLVARNYLRQIGQCHDLTNTFNGKYRRLRADSPSRTVDTKFGQPRLFLHPSENRGFTVREAARVQGFDDDFIFDGTPTEQFRMIGNAVPPPLARSVAMFVRTLL